MAGRKDRLPKLEVPTVEATSPDGAQTVTLRCALTAKSRVAYAETLHGGTYREDAWHRAVELLFERLVVGWTIDDVPTTGQKRLLQRFRAASADERAWIRDALRAHLADWFPEMEAP